MNLFKQLNYALEFAEMKLSNRKIVCLIACLPTLIDLLPKLIVIESLSLVSGKSAFLHDGYIAAIENCCVPIAVKRVLFPMHVASLLLGVLFNTIFATCNFIVIRCSDVRYS